MGNSTNSQSNKTLDDHIEKSKISGFVNVNKK